MGAFLEKAFRMILRRDYWTSNTDPSSVKRTNLPEAELFVGIRNKEEKPC